MVLCTRKGNEMREQVAIHDLNVEPELQSAGGRTERDFIYKAGVMGVTVRERTLAGEVCNQNVSKGAIILAYRSHTCASRLYLVCLLLQKYFRGIASLAASSRHEDLQFFFKENKSRYQKCTRKRFFIRSSGIF